MYTNFHHDNKEGAGDSKENLVDADDMICTHRKNVPVLLLHERS